MKKRRVLDPRKFDEVRIEHMDCGTLETSFSPYDIPYSLSYWKKDGSIHWGFDFLSSNERRVENKDREISLMKGINSKRLYEIVFPENMDPDLVLKRALGVLDEEYRNCRLLKVYGSELLASGVELKENKNDWL